MESDKRRTETLAMRISKAEHDRLKKAAEARGGAEAALVRTAVNEWCERQGQAFVFDIKT